MTTTANENRRKNITSASRHASGVDVVQSVKAKDGARLFYREWLPENVQHVILLVGSHDHEGNSLCVLAKKLMELDAAVFAIERRGSGQSTKAQGVTHFGQLVDDIDTIFRHICEVHGLEEACVIAVGHGLGGLEVATWVHDYAPCLQHAVLLQPELAYDETDDVPNGTGETAKRVIEDAGAIVRPVTLVAPSLLSRKAKNAESQFLDGLNGPVYRVGLTRKFDISDSKVVKDALSRIEKVVGRSTVERDLTKAHCEGYTFDEYAKLKEPLPPGLKSLSFAIQRAALATVGRLSRGVQIGWETGFDSGVSLDHVYENEARGVTFVGKAIDRGYLDAVGWKGIRQRRVHMQRQLAAAISLSATDGQTVRVLDVAAGAGRYVLETVRNHPYTEIDVELRDFHKHNLEKAKAIANDWGVNNVRYKQHDAFAIQSYSGLEGTIDVAIVSGLYELFPDNEDIIRSLAGVRTALKPNGRLIYTNQPWHPQLEMIARVLPSHRGGDSWVMRRRTQAEMDQLVRNVGLRKTGMEIDEWGIFTVSSAVVED